MKLRPSRPLVIWVLILFLIGGGLVFILNDEDEAERQISPEGHLVFPQERSLKTRSDSEPAALGFGGRSRTSWLISGWFMARFEDLMSWERNPWHRKRQSFGSQLWELMQSDDPNDQAKVAELRRKAREMFQQILERYPELAIELRDVPPEKNGFLKWLEFSERMEAEAAAAGRKNQAQLDLPEAIQSHLQGKSTWDASAARTWLAAHAAMMDEIRAIGLLPDRSVAGIDIERWDFISARLPKSCAEALLIEARLAVEEGRTADALRSVQAARGLADHIGNTESPTLLAETVRLLLNLSVEHYTMAEIMPALPAGEVDPVAWEKVVAPPAEPPSRFGDLMKIEWSVSSQIYLLPMLADLEDPYYPPDPADLVDTHARLTLEAIDRFDSDEMSGWTSLTATGLRNPDLSHLSPASKELLEQFYVGADAWGKGAFRAQSTFAMNQAAFDIMQGQPVPVDPVFGQPYRWNPETRELAAPDTPEFKQLDIKPITVPKP